VLLHLDVAHLFSAHAASCQYQQRLAASADGFAGSCSLLPRGLIDWISSQAESCSARKAGSDESDNGRDLKSYSDTQASP
jgi:hypothetical protein